jgi:hypothetical protein
MERIQREKDQLDQESAHVLESERKIEKELRTKNRELTGKTRVVEWSKILCPSID